MNLQLLGWNDTIVALATPPGVGAIGVIRLSGKDAIKMANQLFPSKNLEQQGSHTMHVGYLKSQQNILDEVVISLYKAPRSYTAEDVVEISCHGSPYIQQKIIEACIEKGARLARPGEFTQKAFLNGKLDLTQAEAVADLIASNTSAAQKTALNNMRGGFSHALKKLREELIQFSALIELELDFSQEDVEFVDRGELLELVRKAQEQTDQLIGSFRVGNVIKNGLSVVIIGKPNAGKSTLLNAWLNEDRAIVSEIPGTTRDTIEEVINVEGVLIRLIDTAGIREKSNDIIEGYGIDKSLQKMKEADIILYLFDVQQMEEGELEGVINEFELLKRSYFLVGNKIDRVEKTEMKKKFGSTQGIIFISAREKNNIKEVKKKILDFVNYEGWQGENVIVTNARHYQGLLKFKENLEEIRVGLKNKIPGDLLSIDIRSSLQYLGGITGEITTEDQLDYIFSKFCIGK